MLVLCNPKCWKPLRKGVEMEFILIGGAACLGFWLRGKLS